MWRANRKDFTMKHARWPPIDEFLCQKPLLGHHDFQLMGVQSVRISGFIYFLFTHCCATGRKKETSSFWNFMLQSVTGGPSLILLEGRKQHCAATVLGPASQVTNVFLEPLNPCSFHQPELSKKLPAWTEITMWWPEAWNSKAKNVKYLQHSNTILEDLISGLISNDGLLILWGDPCQTTKLPGTTVFTQNNYVNVRVG